MVKKSYEPERGDVVWINLSPQRGHEQRGKRPVIVLTRGSYNSATGLALVCPMSSQKKGYLSEVDVALKKVQGVALVDQVRSVDWRDRSVRFEERVSEDIMVMIRHRIVEILFK